MGATSMTDQRMFSWREHVQSARLPSTTKLVLLTLSTHMTRMGESCFPTTRQIAWECSLSRVSVMKHLADSEALGWIVRSTHGFAGQRWKNHEYKPAIPVGAKIILWHESEDGIKAANEQQSASEAGQRPLPAKEKGGQGGLPPSNEAGQPPLQSWSTSRAKVVKEVDLSSSIAHQLGVQDIIIGASAAEDPSVKHPSSPSEWMDELVDQYGYEKHRIHNSNNLEHLAEWVQSAYTVDEVKTAVRTSQEGTTKHQPPIGYISRVLASNRLPRSKRSFRPEDRPGYESPDDRAKRMAAEYHEEHRQLVGGGQ